MQLELEDGKSSVGDPGGLFGCGMYRSEYLFVQSSRHGECAVFNAAFLRLANFPDPHRSGT